MKEPSKQFANSWANDVEQFPEADGALLSVWAHLSFRFAAHFADSFLWQKGIHQALHSAGEDLTKILEQAPHDNDILEKFPVVGILHTRTRA